MPHLPGGKRNGTVGRALVPSLEVGEGVLRRPPAHDSGGGRHAARGDVFGRLRVEGPRVESIGVTAVGERADTSVDADGVGEPDRGPGAARGGTLERATRCKRDDEDAGPSPGQRNEGSPPRTPMKVDAAHLLVGGSWAGPAISLPQSALAQRTPTCALSVSGA